MSFETSKPTGDDAETRQWAMILHLSQLAGYIIVPVAGLIAPIVIWQIKKDQLPGIDAHGRAVANWIISALIYGAVCTVLAFTVILAIIAIPALFLLGVVALTYAIIGGVKASSGELWTYPGSIKFF